MLIELCQLSHFLLCILEVNFAAVFFPEVRIGEHLPVRFHKPIGDKNAIKMNFAWMKVPNFLLFINLEGRRVVALSHHRREALELDTLELPNALIDMREGIKRIEELDPT